MLIYVSMKMSREFHDVRSKGKRGFCEKMSNTRRKDIADRMDIVWTDVGLQLGYRCGSTLITVTLQEVIQILGLALTAGVESQRFVFDRRLSVPETPQR
jgi:hypothetical protein